MIAPHCWIAERRRRAFSVFEMTIAVILLATAMSVSVKLLGWLAAERRVAERREVALHEVANLMEQLTAAPWEAIQTKKAWPLSDDARAALPGAELTVRADDRGASKGAHRLAVRLRWRDRAGAWAAPVRLTTWVHPPARTRSER